MKVMLIGSSSKLSLEIADILRGKSHSVIMAGRSGPDLVYDPFKSSIDDMSLLLDHSVDAFIINQGLLFPKNITTQSISEIEKSFFINLISIVRLCELIFEKMNHAKIFIIGSESGKKGSFDTSYFLSKAALRAYVSERKITFPGQQIILFSPSTIADSAMTINRKDIDRLKINLESHPKKRFVTNLEVAKVVTDFLADHFNYLSNIEIEINGGKFARLDYPPQK
jgi:NAD(P)-dependent dehydrogenase (short-subunit alcohol dehydrogenase family)